jgi:leader peptidase (prepilin peptidase)/N-methyltransferase
VSILALVGVGVLGLLVGSFLNVVTHRVPRGESLLHPGSHCPACGHPIRPYHNVPVLGWLLLRGRCADCGAPISPRYPLVELGTAVAFVATGLWLARAGLVSALPAYLYLAAVGIALAVIDAVHHRLPNAITLPSYPVLAALLTASAVWRHDGPSLLRAGMGAAGMVAFYYAIAFAYPAAMGLGDVKLAGLLGAALAFVSWPTLAVGAFAAFVLGAAYGVASRRRTVPFGPFMVAGAFVGLFVAGPVADTYARWLLQL